MREQLTALIACLFEEESTAMEPREQRIQFYDALYSECAEAQINLRAIHVQNDKPAASNFIPLGSSRIRDLEAFVSQYNNGAYIGLYHAVASRNGGGTKEHIVEFPALWVEIDFKDTAEKQARKSLEEYYFPPSAIIFSGGGLHCYWFLKEPATREDTPLVEQTLKALARVLDADPSGAEAARILRIPGTINRKYSPARPVTLEYCKPQKRYNLEDIAGFLPVEKEPTPEPSVDHRKSTDIDRVMQCLFMQHCDEDRKTLSEPEWYCMVSNLARCQGGPRKIHDLSSGYPNYRREETNSKILHAINDANPHTCQYIKKLWDCGTDCGVKAPAALALKTTTALVQLAPFNPSDTSIAHILENKPPPREYYFQDILPKGVVGGIYALGGVSKSFLLRFFSQLVVYKVG